MGLSRYIRHHRSFRASSPANMLSGRFLRLGGKDFRSVELNSSSPDSRETGFIDDQKGYSGHHIVPKKRGRSHVRRICHHDRHDSGGMSGRHSLDRLGATSIVLRHRHGTERGSPVALGGLDNRNNQFDWRGITGICGSAAPLNEQNWGSLFRPAALPSGYCRFTALGERQ